MAASTITEPDGHAAGRVTITGLAVGLIPPILTVLVVVGLFLLDIITAEVAAAVILGVLANAGLTSSTVFTVQKRTPTDQYAVRTEIVPVAAPDPELKAAAAAETLDADAAAGPEPADPEEDVPAGTGAHRATLDEELTAYRPARGVL